MKKQELNTPVPLLGQVRAFTDEQKTERFHEFVLSTESVDRHGTVFRSEGWKLDEYNANNPVVSYVHEDNNADPDLIIGTARVFRDGNQIIGRVYYEPEDINPLAEKIRKKVEHGTLRMASISAIPTKGHFGVEANNEDRDVLYFDEQELIAWSIVPVGSNRDALKRSAAAIETVKSEIVRNLEVSFPETVTVRGEDLRRVIESNKRMKPAPSFRKGGIVPGKSLMTSALERMQNQDNKEENEQRLSLSKARCLTYNYLK